MSTSGQPSQRFFLIVERPDNWLVDHQEGFLKFGLPTQKRKFGEKLKKGDILITYISGGVSAISDCRKVSRDGIITAQGPSGYDDPFPWQVSTEPLEVLPQKNWIPMRPLLGRLALTRDHKDWRQLVRVSIRSLSEQDGKLLVRMIINANKTQVV